MVKVLKVIYIKFKNYPKLNGKFEKNMFFPKIVHPKFFFTKFNTLKKSEPKHASNDYLNLSSTKKPIHLFLSKRSKKHLINICLR